MKKYSFVIVVEIVKKKIQYCCNAIYYFRLRFRRDFRLVVRCFSDRPTDNDGKIPDETIKNERSKKPGTTSQSDSEKATEKIQELLKSMMSGPKFDESEYRAKFTTAPDINRRRKQKDEIEIKTEKIGILLNK